MSWFFEFLIFACIAIFIENAVFSRALGIGRVLLITKRPKLLAFFTLLLAIIMIFSSALYWVLGLISIPAQYKTFTDLGFAIVSVLLVYLIVYAVAYRCWSNLFKRINRLIPQAAINCTVFGTLLLARGHRMNLAQAIGFGFGTSVGFALAVVVVAWGQRRLRLANLPQAFKGLPAMLVYIGILSMAFYGLVGHQLPF